MGKTAIILGATGLTGGLLLQNLLEDASYERVKLFSRSSVGFTHEKLEEQLVDLLELENYPQEFTGDIMFCCIGTTNAKTPNEELYRKIDYGIPVAAAQLAKANQIETLLVVSALGADPDSRMFYNRTKGEMEREVLKMGIKNTYILQPSLIGGKRGEKRFGESMAKFFMSLFGFLVPKKYKMIAPETIAKAMQKVAAEGYTTTRIPSEKIKEIATL
jgi:uncharacterized protein YbjT (DUF2867 family)